MELDYLELTEQKKKQFISKGINSVEDLIRFIPRAYDDYTIETALNINAPCCLTVECMKVEYKNGRKPYITATCFHRASNHYIKVRWFNQNFLYRTLKDYQRMNVLLCGNIVYSPDFNSYSCANPKIFSDNIAGEKRIHPTYSKIRGMSDTFLWEKARKALNLYEIVDPLPEDILKKYDLIPLNEAYRKLHVPERMKDVEEGRKRLIFNELLYFTLSMEKNSRNISRGSQFNVKSLALFNKLVSNLPYDLTDDQKNVINDMVKNIKEGRRLSALLQGDVSCGKSIVAFLMASAMAGSGYQTAIMAPTQALARQHYDELSGLLKGTGATCVYYEGTKMKAAEKRKMLSEIKSGEAEIIVGTHALLGKDIEYGNLALTIVDEEHKFGVLQKQALVEKAAAGVHSITMSATPIPRSLSQVVYDSSTQIYTIKQMPPGRQKVKSCVTNNRIAVYKFVAKELAKGHQAYVVCPAIETNEKRENIKSVTDTLTEYRKHFPSVRIEALTGKNKKDEVAEYLHDFKNGDIKILIATTVIEVGVNVPNATVIIIENAENFGLAGLHQLRGRVGRGKDQGYCIFASEMTDNERLQTLVSTTDGFKIAEKDLEMRGSGEFIGTKQSGDDKYISLVMSDMKNRELYLKLKEDAEALYDTGECEEFLENYDKNIL